jgi:hypothetical protein
MPLPRFRAGAACAAAASFAICGTAFAASSSSDTTMKVSPRVETAAPATSPASFPGVASVREGARLPRGWVVVERDVRIMRGGEPAFPALRMTCPRGTSWRSGTSSDDIDIQVLERNARGKRSVLVMATFSTSAVRVGETAAGTVFALCR